MVAAGAAILPRNGSDKALEGDGVTAVLEAYQTMWDDGMIPESAEVDTGANFVAAFVGGNIGIAGTGGFLISLMKREHPDFNYRLTLLPGNEPGQVSGFVGGDMVAIDMDEAAPVDGASSFFTLRRVFLPLVMPGMVTVAPFAFVGSRNEFLGALIMMNSEDSFTVPIMLTGVESVEFGSANWGGLQASVIVSKLPCLLVYVLLQTYNVSGFLSGAVK